VPVADHNETDEPFGHLPEPGPEPAAPVEVVRGHIPHRYRRSAGASMLAAGLIGLREVIEPPKDDRPVVEQYADDGDRERPVEVYLDPDDPAASMVVVRDPNDLN
jgi:hypothetical protein